MPGTSDVDVFGTVRVFENTPFDGGPSTVVGEDFLVHAFFCPSCPNIHLQLDCKRGNLSINLILTDDLIDSICNMLRNPVVAKPEDMRDGSNSLS